MNKQMSKFKAGDKVRPNSHSSKGMLCTVIRKATTKNCWLIDGGVKEGVGVCIEDGYNSYHENFLDLVEPKHKFKVGDKVRMLEEDGNGEYKIGDIVYIAELSSIPFVARNKEDALHCRYSNCISEGNAELVEEECKSCCGEKFDEQLVIEKVKNYYYCNEPICSSRNKTESIMSKLTSFVKNSLLSTDEKLLRKYSLKDDCGEYTSEAEVLVQQKLIKDNEAYLIEVATAMEAEEKKNK